MKRTTEKGSDMLRQQRQPTHWPALVVVAAVQLRSGIRVKGIWRRSVASQRSSQ